MLKNGVFEACGKERNLSKKERNLSRKERNLSREVQDLIFRLKSYGWRTLLFSLQTPFHLAEDLDGLDNNACREVRLDRNNFACPIV